MMNDSTKTEVKFSRQTLLRGLFFLAMISVAVFILAVLVVFLESNTSSNISAAKFALLIGGIALAFYIAASIQMPLHELGHLLFGKLSGYQLLFFRIGSFMWQQREGKLEFQRVKFAGSDGHCLMIPPQREVGDFPFVLYNLGGIIVNFFVAAIAALLAVLTSDTQFLSLFFILVAAFGLAYIIMNGIPIVTDKKYNDGYNIYTISKIEGGRRAYLLHLQIREQIVKGKRLKEMPAAWFNLPAREAMNNGLMAGIGIFAYKRMLDMLDIDQADQLMAQLLELDSITANQRKFMIVDRVYCELVRNNRKEVLEHMLEKRQTNFMDVNKFEPGIIRTIFTYELLGNKKPDLAHKFKKIFEQVTAKYPFPAQLDMERDLMSYAEIQQNQKTP